MSKVGRVRKSTREYYIILYQLSRFIYRSSGSLIIYNENNNNRAIEIIYIFMLLSNSLVPAVVLLNKLPPIMMMKNLHPFVESFPLIMTTRGGGAAAAVAAFDMSLESQNVGVLSSYGVVTALIMNSALRLYTSNKLTYKKDKDNNNNLNNTISILFSFFISLCIMSGAFTAVAFQLLSIYSRTSLGHNNIVGYQNFRQATAKYRIFGFHSFLVSLVSFVISFLLSYTEEIKKYHKDNTIIGRVLLYSSVLLALLGVHHIHAITELATQFVFS